MGVGVEAGVSNQDLALIRDVGDDPGDLPAGRQVNSR